MRVLFCNKYNYRFSGTEVYLFELMELMRQQALNFGTRVITDDILKVDLGRGTLPSREPSTCGRSDQESSSLTSEQRRNLSFWSQSHVSTVYRSVGFVDYAERI